MRKYKRSRQTYWIGTSAATLHPGNDGNPVSHFTILTHRECSLNIERDMK